MRDINFFTCVIASSSLNISASIVLYELFDLFLQRFHFRCADHLVASGDRRLSTLTDEPFPLAQKTWSYAIQPDHKRNGVAGLHGERNKTGFLFGCITTVLLLVSDHFDSLHRTLLKHSSMTMSYWWGARFKRRLLQVKLSVSWVFLVTT